MLNQPKIIWKDNIAYSAEYDDIFFSKEGGDRETEHVFLKPNGIPSRFTSETSTTIIELGFGTGLNFYITADAFIKSSIPGSMLHYVSLEKSPLSSDLIREILSGLQMDPSLRAVMNRYLLMNPPPSEGFHRIIFEKERIYLTLIYGDAEEKLKEISGRTDVWFLDGFSPSKNPELWNKNIFSQIKRLSSPDASASTYSTAKMVRENFTESGFKIEKIPGFGKKKEMLHAVFEGEKEKISHQIWFSRLNIQINKSKKAVIIGAGLSGSFAARSLAARNFEVSLIDRSSDPAMGASGNPSGILYPGISGDITPFGRINLSGYLYTLRLFQSFQNSNIYKKTGVLQLSNLKKSDDLLKKALKYFPSESARYVNNKEASEISGIDLANGGLYFPDGGTVNPAELCRKNISDFESQINWIPNTFASKLIKESGIWHVLSEDGNTIASAENVILATSYSTLNFSQTDWLPLKRNRGQIALNFNFDQLQGLKTVLCSSGYISPGAFDETIAGASYDENFKDESPSIKNQDEIFDKINESLIHKIDKFPSEIQGRVSSRASMIDHLPVVGPIPDVSFYKDAYSGLADGKKNFKKLPVYEGGLYVSAGFSSRGLVYAPLAGEIIAAYINNEIMPVEKSCVHALHPSRFIIRNLIKGKAV